MTFSLKYIYYGCWRIGDSEKSCVREESKICYFVENVQKYYENQIIKNKNKSEKSVKNKINWKIDKEKY